MRNYIYKYLFQINANLVSTREKKSYRSQTFDSVCVFVLRIFFFFTVHDIGSALLMFLDQPHDLTDLLKGRSVVVAHPY